jgi:hypothetical protein
MSLNGQNSYWLNKCRYLLNNFVTFKKKSSLVNFMTNYSLTQTRRHEKAYEM